MFSTFYNAVQTAFSNIFNNNPNSIVTRYRYATTDNQYNDYYIVDFYYRGISKSEQIITWLKVFIANLFSTTEFLINFTIILFDKFLPFLGGDIFDKIVLLKETLEFIQLLLQNIREEFEKGFYRGLLYLSLLILIGIYLFRDNYENNNIFIILKFRDFYRQIYEG